MRKSLFCIIALLVVFFTLTKKAHTLFIDFETLSDGDMVTTQFPGLSFSKATVMTAGISLNEFEFPPHSGSNVVFDDGGTMTIDFSTPMTDVGGYFTYSTELTLSFFDVFFNLAGTITSAFNSNLALSGDTGSSPNEFLNFAWALGISRMSIEGDPLGGSFTMDDLQGTPVPEPSSLLFLATGLAGIIGWSFRKMKRQF